MFPKIALKTKLSLVLLSPISVFLDCHVPRPNWSVVGSFGPINGCLIHWLGIKRGGRRRAVSHKVEKEKKGEPCLHTVFFPQNVISYACNSLDSTARLLLSHSSVHHTAERTAAAIPFLVCVLRWGLLWVTGRPDKKATTTTTLFQTNCRKTSEKRTRTD